MPSATATIPDCSGKFVDGRYRLTDVIGSGSFGVVYQAIDESVAASDNNNDGDDGDSDAARSVAVKVVDKSNKRLRDPSHLRMEIALHKRASLLPRAVTLRAAPEDEQFAYLVMDLCRGGSLGRHLERHGPYTDGARLKRTFLAIVDAVADLHRAGIYHRDIKPGNILLRRLWPRDAQRGIQLLRGHPRSLTGGGRCTELLCPKFNSRPSSAQSDVWALGIVLLNMLSGRVPWQSASTYEAAYVDFVRDPRHLLRSAYFPVSVGLNRVVRRMLRHNPAIRMRLDEVRAAVEELDGLAMLREVEVPVAVREVDIGEEGVVVDAGVVVNEEEGHRVEESKGRERESAEAAPRKTSDDAQEMLRSTVQCEMDIVAAQRARKEAVRQRHEEACAAAAVRGGGGGSTLDFGPNTAARARARKGSGGSKGSSSTKSSTMAATPADSDVVIEKKDIGERMREIVARVKFKFRSR
uniref:non-specific serine/threonine protein kinase n=1 Tax=Ganoderma boninense TaxID=34458 RepID=A0A5K1JUX2_9APHY|nr:Protein kinase domain-containing protein [Ganoderma boninense]